MAIETCTYCGKKGSRGSFFNKLIADDWYGVLHQKCLKKIEQGLDKKDPEFEKYRYHLVHGEWIDKEGFFANGFNRYGIHKETGDKYDLEGYAIDGLDKEGYRRNGFNEKGIHKETGTKFDSENNDIYGFNQDAIHKVTGTKYDEYDYDYRGFDKNGNNARTGTKYDENGYDKFGYGVNGFNEKGVHKDTGTKFDKNGYSKDGIHKDTGTKFNKNGFEISGLIAEYCGSEFEMIAFKGQEKFAKLISGGTVDFYDSDSPAYILNVKLNISSSEDFKEKLLYTIRNSYVIKPSIFPTRKSIGAYWQIDNIEESTAKMLLERIMKKFRNKVEES